MPQPVLPPQHPFNDPRYRPVPWDEASPNTVVYLPHQDALKNITFVAYLLIDPPLKIVRDLTKTVTQESDSPCVYVKNGPLFLVVVKPDEMTVSIFSDIQAEVVLIRSDTLGRYVTRARPMSSLPALYESVLRSDPQPYGVDKLFGAWDVTDCSLTTADPKTYSFHLYGLAAGALMNELVRLQQPFHVEPLLENGAVKFTVQERVLTLLGARLENLAGEMPRVNP